MLGESEIYKLNDECLWIDQNILWLDIAVHDSFIMKKFKSVTQLIRYVAYFLIIQVSSPGLLNAFVKGDKVHRHVFKYEVYESTYGKAFKKLNDVGVIMRLM